MYTNPPRTWRVCKALFSMRTRTLEIVLLIIITVSAVGVFSYVGLHALVIAPQDDSVPITQSTQSHQTEPPATPGEIPRRLIIPSLNINAAVQSVGINGKGAMGVPSNYTDVAWYKSGTTPGHRGSAVIDGHVDNGLALSGVFKHLEDIRAGADVYIETAAGKRLHFVVQDIEMYDYKDVPVEQLFNRSDQSRLNLITCGGHWVKNDKTYDHRVVVYTVLAPN
jgi:LPXTG-site transpeptidase (sortase) family protein